MTDTRFFKAEKDFSLAELAELSSCSIAKDASNGKRFKGVAAIDNVTTDEVTTCYDKSFVGDLKSVAAGVCVTTEKMAGEFSDSVSVLVSKEPRRAFALIIRAFYPIKLPNGYISDKANIDKTAKIGNGVRIEAGAYIGENVEIGDGCYIEANAVIKDGVIMGQGCHIGANATIECAILGNGVRIYTGCRIGQDGFGFELSPKGHLKIPQLGRVIIEDGVEIGANTCIDRGALNDTVIGAGTVMDNLIQIGHNNKLGKGCVIVSQVGIAGSCTFGDGVVAAGQTGFKDHLHIGSGAQIGAQSGVMQDIPAGQSYLGSPAMPAYEYLRQIALLRKISKFKDLLGMFKEEK